MDEGSAHPHERASPHMQHDATTTLRSSSAPTTPRRLAGASEHGVTMVELLVVLLIIAVVAFAGLASMRGTQGQSQANRARAVAMQLGEAIQQFQRDHGGRPPGEPGAADWRWTDRQVNWWVSPVDRGNSNRPYASARALEALTDRAVSLERSDGTTHRGASTTARIRYVADRGRQVYVLVVLVNRSGRLAAECFVSNSTLAHVRHLLPKGLTRPC